MFAWFEFLLLISVAVHLEKRPGNRLFHVQICYYALKEHERRIKSDKERKDGVFLVWYLPVAPQLVPLRAVAVEQGDGAAVGDGVEANLLGVHRVAHTDVLPPPEREHLQGGRTFNELVSFQKATGRNRRLLERQDRERRCSELHSN